MHSRAKCNFAFCGRILRLDPENFVLEFHYVNARPEHFVSESYYVRTDFLAAYLDWKLIYCESIKNSISWFLGDIDRLRKLKKSSLDGS